MLRSAGGIVVRWDGSELRVAVMQSAYGTWVFPKGRIESDEKPEDTARRELFEEIRLTHLQLLCPLGRTQYQFEQEGERHRKRVDWFLFQAPPGATLHPNPSENVVDCGWFTIPQALKLLSHSNQRRLLRRATARFREDALL